MIILSAWSLTMLLRLGLLLLVLLPGFVLADDPVLPTRIITTMELRLPKDFDPAGGGVTGKSFQVDPALGDVWVVYQYTAMIVDDSKGGVSSFSVMPTGVPVPASDVILYFDSRYMAQPKEYPDLTITMSGVSKTFTAEELREILDEREYEEYLAAVRQPDTLRHLIEVRRYQVPPGEETAIRVETLTMENMKPHKLEVVVGQGAMPPALLAFIEKTNGNLFYRHRTLIAGLAGGVLLIIAFFRRQLR